MTTSFVDTSKREWNLEISIGDVRRVKKQIRVDLMQADAGTLLADLAEDPVKLFEVIACLLDCSESETEELFNAANGEVAANACNAFVEALIAFFLTCRPAAARSMETMWNRFQAIQAEAGEMTAAKLNSPEMDKLIADEMEKASKAIDEAIANLCG